MQDGGWMSASFVGMALLEVGKEELLIKRDIGPDQAPIADFRMTA